MKPTRSRLSAGLFLLLWVAALLPAPAFGQEKVRFFAFGDWGTGSSTQKAVAHQVKRLCSSRGCDFGLSLGDNFYPSGVSGVEDPQWREKFEDIYGSLRLPFYAALGNHDDRGSVRAQIEYSKKNPLWILPDRQYSFRIPDSKSPLLEVFVLDSDQFDPEAQRWLTQALSRSTATWKFLVLHHPILNVGDKHPPDQKKLYPLLKPVICGKIDFILSGHEHIFSHLRDKSDSCGWEQIILGTGGARLYGIEAHPPVQYEVLAAESKHGLGYFELDRERLRFRFLRSDGHAPYSFERKPKLLKK